MTVTEQPKSLYRWILTLAVPIVLQNVVSFSVSLTDNLMAGSLGERALSAVFVSNQIQVLLNMMIIGLGAAITILSSQYWGKRDVGSIRQIAAIALKFAVAVALAVTLATLLFPEKCLRLFTDDEAVIAESVKYLAIQRFSYLFFSITQVLIAAMRSVERVKIGMSLTLVTFFVNLTLNWVLVFGVLGAPKLGIQGLAIATLTARVLEAVIMLLFVRLVDDRLRLRIADLVKTDFALLRDFFRYAFPVITGDILWGVNMAVQGAIIGRLGETALASVSIANTAFSVMSVAVYGTAGASAIIIGKTVGTGDYERARAYAKKLQLVFIAIGVVSGLLFFVSKDAIILLYRINPDTIALATRLMTVLSVTLVGTSYQMSTLTGIVRAGGSVYFVLINDLIFVWVIVIPSACLAAFVFHASPVVVFMCLKCDQILKGIVAVIAVNKYQWIRKLTRETPENETA